jgi:hypothetical protein
MGESSLYVIGYIILMGGSEAKIVSEKEHQILLQYSQGYPWGEVE